MQEHVEVDCAVFYERVVESVELVGRQFGKMEKAMDRFAELFPKSPEPNWWDEEYYEEHRVIAGVIRFNIPLDCPQCGHRQVHISNYTIRCMLCEWKRERLSARVR